MEKSRFNMYLFDRMFHKLAKVLKKQFPRNEIVTNKYFMLYVM